MIEVDIKVPYLGRTYDFSLDETMPISTVISDIVSEICANERWDLPSAQNELGLYLLAQKRPLAISSTLQSEGIHTGQALILC